MKTSGDAALNAVKSQKGKGFKAFKRWEKYWDQRVFSDGSFPPANLVQKNWELYQFEKSLSALIPGSSWSSLGPNSSSGGYAGIGRINRLTFHPTNTSIIFACTAGGGLWKTTNGGTSWVPLTDNLASIGTSGLVINPTDPNIMYLATGDGDGADTYSYGVLKSTDGGVTWNTTGLTFTTGTVIYKLQQHATDPNILLAGTNGGLYRTANGGTSWTKVVASGHFVAALVSNTSNGFKGFYASVDGGLTYTLRSSTPNLMGWETNGSDSGGQAWYDLCMAVSPTDVNQIIVGGVNTWKSNNGGVSWSIMTNWYQTSTVPAMHADQHDLIFLNSTTIYAANDGGIYRSTNNGVSWTDLTNGMSISQLYRAGASQTDTRIIAGLQDNGTKLRSTTGTWSDEIGGDGMDCAIDPTNASFMYGTLYYGDIQRSTNGGSSWTSITPSTGTDGAWVSPVLLDPVNPATIYLGYKDLMKSTDRGTTWSKITAGQTGGNFISNIAVAPSDPSVIYISWGTALAKTINGGSNWTTITAPISSQISSLMVDPTNPNNLYATYSNFTAGSKVYFSNNGGTSWTNISGTLPNIPANKIIYQTGSNGALYLGMDVGIYYRDNTQTDWSLYNSGLPNVEIFDLEIRYSDKKLIAATYGRGLWESPLYVGTPLSVPAVSSFSPTSATKGNTVTITGSNFNGVSSVSFGGTAANSFTVVSSTSINAIVGNGNSGNVTVTNSAGTGSLSGFTYINTAPTISSFTPTSGKTGQVVNIIGTNFTGATAVSFGGTAATTYTVVSATSINATVGAGTSGTVSVTTASGTGTLAGFTYLPPPTIASFSPISAGTGQTVTITGTNFTGATAVSLGGTAATSFTVVSATSITAVVGAGATGSVSVTTANGIASRAGFTFITATPAPTISSFTPTSGKTGQVVTITGTNFTGATAVSFGGTAATTFTVVSATSINATVGAGASGVVSVTTASGTGTLAGFTYLPPPTITSFSPTSAGTGQTVTITGTNFTGATAVSLGGTAATSFTVVSATSITAVVGTGATGSVSVTTSNGIGSRAGFTFISATPAPAISSFTPTSGNTGQVVTITGTNFTGATAVSFGGTAATTFTVLSATSINATVGAGTSGTVSVTTASGTGTLAGFTYLPPPTITSFSPTSGKTGQVVTITGTNFTGATAVSFGGTAATSFTVVSATSITAVVGTGKTGNVRVVTANGAITKSGFIYLAPPTISSFSPTSAGTGQTVTISGTNFTGGTIVSFGGTPATSFTVVSATSITAVVGAGATGSVSVTTSNGIDSRAGFTFISATTAPAISSFTPTSGKTGQVVTITGTNFTGATAVSFGGTAATSFTLVSATSINATIGAGASGTVSVTTASGTGTLAGFTYLPPPTIASFSPTSAGTGQTVTITGTNFTGATGVSFGGTAATSFTVVSATSITAVVGAGTTGNVRVTTANGNVNRAGFTFITAITVPPTITSFSPTKAIPGSNITLSGTGFNPTLSQNTVWIGATKANISSVTTTTITAKVPVGATTDYIRILNSGTQQSVQSNQFFVSSFSPSRDSISSIDITPKFDLTTLANPEDVRVSDLDGDGKPDILVANYGAGSFSVFSNTSVAGNINIANFSRKDFTSGSGSTFVSVADMDNDGKQDVIVANQGENTLSIFKNISTSGNISFNSPVKLTTPSTPVGIGIGDFDRNGWLDIATANHGNGTVSIFTNKGIFNAISTNNFNPRFGLITGLNPITIDVADIDGDSKSDIVVGNYGSNSISIFKNNYISGTLATTSFSTKLDFNAGNKPGYVKLGDMDGDSKLDVVVLAEGTNSFGILRNISTAGVLSSTSFASRVNFNTGITPYYISVGDLTGNGKLDILITNFGDGTATVWQNKATPGSITSASFFKRLNFTVGTKPYAGLLADIDGDAKTDILVSNNGSNTLSILRNTVGAQMIVSPTSSTLPATGGSLTASISSNLVWKVSSNANWLIPIGVSGKNSGSIRVTFLANNGISRKGTITFTADGITRTMEIIQAAKPGIMNPANELSGEFSEKMEVNAKEITHIDWELFPNPSDGIVNLSVKFSNLLETGILNISDIHGRVVRSVTNVRTGNYQFDLSSEPKGTYLFSLQDENGKGLNIKQIILN
ncbi:MAG: IPT/TIG domain-containing protein [Saprospiraceae bacterium]|nr:IPT/TIG domain-containing protein [Saprospiraceae bacterium]